MVQHTELSGGRWSSERAALTPRTRAFLLEQVGPGDGRPSAERTGMVDRGQWPDAPLALQQDTIGSMGMSWMDVHAAREGIFDPSIVGVMTPTSIEGIQAAMAWAKHHGFGIIPRGGGTSVVGGLVAERRSVVLDLRGMRGVLDFDPVSGTVHVEAGMTGPELEAWLAPKGFEFGHVPQSWERATLGGHAVTCSAGQASNGVGRFADNVLRLRLVTPRGVWQIGHPPASAVGPDYRGLIAASEGTLGVVTDLELRVRPAPTHVVSRGALAPDFSHAVEASRELVQRGLQPDVMRISDIAESRATWAMSGPDGWKSSLAQAYASLRRVNDGAVLIMQWRGGVDVHARQRAAWRILRAHGVVTAGGAVGRQWVKHRFEGPRLRDTLIDEGYFVETLETASTWANLQHVHRVIGERLMQFWPSSYVMAHVSHMYPAGASVYFTVVTQASAAAQWADVKAAVTDAIVGQAGTPSHHHGVGTLHAPWLAPELGEIGMDVWRAIKSACDPDHLMNPAVWDAWQR